MNWSKGLFRLWLVGAVIFVSAVAFVGYRDVAAKFDNAQWENLVPILCGDARGSDYFRTDPVSRKPDQDSTNVFDTCWYRMPKFRALYPEYNDLSDQAVLAKTFQKNLGASAPTIENPWLVLARWAGIAVGPPLLVLLLGAALLWAVAGFAPKPT